MGFRTRPLSYVTGGNVKKQSMISVRNLHAHTSQPRISVLGLQTVEVKVPAQANIYKDDHGNIIFNHKNLAAYKNSLIKE